MALKTMVDSSCQSQETYKWRQVPLKGQRSSAKPAVGNAGEHSDGSTGVLKVTSASHSARTALLLGVTTVLQSFG